MTSSKTIKSSEQVQASHVFRGQSIREMDEAREKQDLKKLEAIFFVSARFLNMQELISLTNLNPILIRELVEKLKEKYEKDDSAIEIVHKKGEGTEMWKMDVKPEFSNMINRLATGNSEFSKAEKETLAIIAYKQPIKQSVLVKIRGNKAYEHIKKFMDLQLIKKKRLGHTYELSVADDFFDYFNLNASNELQESLKEIPTEN